MASLLDSALPAVPLQWGKKSSACFLLLACSLMNPGKPSARSQPRSAWTTRKFRASTEELDVGLVMTSTRESGREDALMWNQPQRFRTRFPSSLNPHHTPGLVLGVFIRSLAGCYLTHDNDPTKVRARPPFFFSNADTIFFPSILEAQTPTGMVVPFMLPISTLPAEPTSASWCLSQPEATLGSPQGHHTGLAKASGPFPLPQELIGHLCVLHSTLNIGTLPTMCHGLFMFHGENASPELPGRTPFPGIWGLQHCKLC